MIRLTEIIIRIIILSTIAPAIALGLIICSLVFLDKEYLDMGVIIYGKVLNRKRHP